METVDFLIHRYADTNGAASGKYAAEGYRKHFAKRLIIRFRFIVRNAGNEKRFVRHIRKKIGDSSENISAFFFFRINKIAVHFGAVSWKLSIF